MAIARRDFVLTGLCALAPAITAHAAVELAGQRIDEAVDVAGTRLSLNGAGTRFAAIVRVYNAALYTSRKVGSIEELIAAPGPKRMAISMLREMDSADLGKRFTRGVEDNLPRAELSKVVPGLIRMGQIFSEHKKLMPRETFTIDWIPGTGTIISVKGRQQGEPFKEPEFFGALMSIWLGKSPADARLKELLLGRTPPAPSFQSPN